MKLSTASSLLLSFSNASFISARNINQEYCALCTLVYASSGSDLESCLENFRCDSTKLRSSSNVSSQISEEVKKANLRGIEAPPDLNVADVGILQANDLAFVATTNMAEESRGDYSFVRCLYECADSTSTFDEYYSCLIDRCELRGSGKLSFLAAKDSKEFKILQAKDSAFVATSTADDCNDDCRAYTGTFDDYISCVKNYCRIKASGELSFLATEEDEEFDDFECLDNCYSSTGTGPGTTLDAYFSCAWDSCGIELGYANNSQCEVYCYYDSKTISDFYTCLSGCPKPGFQTESNINHGKMRLATRMSPKLAASKKKLLKNFNSLTDKPNTDEGSVSCEEICEIVHPGMPEAVDQCKADCPN